MKAHKEVPQYTITKDNLELVAKKVQDCTKEENE
jgi:hypothetical protein